MLVTTDAAAYMIAAMNSLKVLFPKMLHVTCFAHALHRLAEFVRHQFPDVNSLISSVKAVFVKVFDLAIIIVCSTLILFVSPLPLQSPSRRVLFKEKCTGIPLPPEPVVTRWGTWLQACEYYADHYEEVKSVIVGLDEADAESIKKAKISFASTDVHRHLAFIKANFMCVAKGIIVLETKGLDLKAYLDVVEGVCLSMRSLESQEYAEKFDRILARNPGFNSIKQIKEGLYVGEQNPDLDEYVANLSPSEMAMFKFAVVTSVDVERVFSIYKTVLSEHRRSFTFENFKQHLTFACNKDLS